MAYLYISIVVVVMMVLIGTFEVHQVKLKYSKVVMKNVQLKKPLNDDGRDTNVHHYTFSQHARERMSERGISIKACKLAIQYGKQYNDKDIRLVFNDIPKVVKKNLKKISKKNLMNCLPLIVCTSRKNPLVISTVFREKSNVNKK